MFVFAFKTLSGEPIIFPLPPEQFTTKVGNKNKTVDLISIGEANIIKTIGLREFSFKIFLPSDSSLCEIPNEYHEPIFYLNYLRKIKESKKPVYFIVYREKLDGSYMFNGNLLVTIENYTVNEKGGAVNDFEVDITLKEYRNIKQLISGTADTTDIQNSIKNIRLVTKEIPKEVKTKEGDSLWDIAKIHLGDGSRYKEIAILSGITQYNNLKAGITLKLPTE